VQTASKVNGIKKVNKNNTTMYQTIIFTNLYGFESIPKKSVSQEG
jgi:hypothetical protein